MIIPLDSKPEECAALGRLVGHWGKVEHELQCLLGTLLGIDNKMAEFIFQSFVSVDSKITLLRRLNLNFYSNRKFTSNLETQLVNAENLSTQRNEFVHSLWRLGPENSLIKFVGYLPRKYKNEHKSVTIGVLEIQSVVDKMSELSTTLYNLQNQIVQELQEPQ